MSFLKFIRRDNAAGAVRLAAKREQAAAKSRARALLKAKTKGKKPPKAATVEPAAVQAPAAPAGHPALYYFAAMAFFFFAVLSKPAAVALVAVLLFMALCLSQRPWWWTSAWVVPHAVAATTLILFTTQQQFPEGPALVVEWWQRPIVAGDAWLFYFRKIVAPISFAVDYARRPGVVLNNPWRIAGSVLPYIAGFTLLWQRKRFPLSFIAFTVFSLFVLPNLGFITFAYQFMSTVCDRYAYMAMLAPALLVSRIGGLSLPRVNLVYGVAVAVLAVLGWETTALVQTWANERALFGHSVEVEPGGAVALVALGNDASNHGDWDGAIRYLEQAGHNHPLWARVHNNMGNSYIHKNQWERAVDELKQAIGLFPTYPLALNNLCGAYLGLERWADADAACNQALRFAPDFNMVYENLGYSAFKQGDPAKAERYFRVAVGLAPTEIKPRRNLTSALLAEHKYAEALPELQILTRIAPNDLHIALDLGATLKALGRRPEAMAVYQSFPVRPGDQQAVAALQQAAAE